MNPADKDQFLSDFARFEQTPPFARSAWLAPLRKSAIERFVELGYPTTRQEEWRHTNVAPISQVGWSRVLRRSDSLKAADLSPVTFGDGECSQIVFLDGHYSEQLSNIRSLPKGVRVRSLAAALEADRAMIEPHLGRIAGFENDPCSAGRSSHEKIPTRH